MGCVTIKLSRKLGLKIKFTTSFSNSFRIHNFIQIIIIVFTQKKVVMLRKLACCLYSKKNIFKVLYEQKVVFMSSSCVHVICIDLKIHFLMSVHCLFKWCSIQFPGFLNTAFFSKRSRISFYLHIKITAKLTLAFGFRLG